MRLFQFVLFNLLLNELCLVYEIKGTGERLETIKNIYFTFQFFHPTLSKIRRPGQFILYSGVNFNSLP